MLLSTEQIERLSEKVATYIIEKTPVMNECPSDTLMEILEEQITEFVMEERIDKITHFGRKDRGTLEAGENEPPRQNVFERK